MHPCNGCVRRLRPEQIQGDLIGVHCRQRVRHVKEAHDAALPRRQDEVPRIAIVLRRRWHLIRVDPLPKSVVFVQFRMGDPPILVFLLSALRALRIRTIERERVVSGVYFCVPAVLGGNAATVFVEIRVCFRFCFRFGFAFRF